MSDERHEGQREFDLLDRVDLLIATLPPGDPIRRELLDLRMEISQREEIFVEARQTIEKLEEVIKKVTYPANRIGTFLGNVGKETAHIVVGGPAKRPRLRSSCRCCIPMWSRNFTIPLGRDFCFTGHPGAVRR